MFDISAKIPTVKKLLQNLSNKQKQIAPSVNLTPAKKHHLTVILGSLACLMVIIGNNILPIQTLISPIANYFNPLEPLKESKSSHEVFGFAPYWSFNKLDNVNFNVLTTFSYFGINVNPDGTLEKSGVGYDTFQSQKATEIFKKAHDSGTRVVVTLTQMKNKPIEELLDDPNAQAQAISQAVDLVEKRRIDGINVDFEYSGDPGQVYRDKFSEFVKNLTQKMHQSDPASKVTVSVYAASVKDPKIYDIASLGQNADGVFMMAYDFAVTGSDNAIPTAPLYGYKEGKYWYDVSTAVNDFLTKMPADKLILGVPWYGYNYAVETPEVKATTTDGYYQYYKRGKRTYSYFISTPAKTQTYSIIQSDVVEAAPGISSYKTGWDDYGKVSYKSYYSNETGTWRMVFVDDPRSLSYKYDFALNKKLGGVGIWALGFDDGSTDQWNLLSEKFGTKLADSSVYNREIINVEGGE